MFDVIGRLPGIAMVRDHSRALAMLDAIMSPEWESRYYSYDSRWAPGEEMASMRNGSGDDYSIVFTAAGAFARGYDHESPTGRVPGPVEGVPPGLAGQVTEPAFCDEDGTLRATVCFWREAEDDAWRCGEVAVSQGGGVEWLFGLLVDRSPEAYREFAEEYYETAVELGAVRRVFALEVLTEDLVACLNPEVSLRDVADDREEIGYPGVDGTP